MQKTIAEYNKEVKEIKERSRVAEFAYQLSEEDGKRLLEIIKDLKDSTDVDLEDRDCYVHSITSMFVSMVDRDFARELRKLLNDGSSFDNEKLELAIRANLMRMAGF